MEFKEEYEYDAPINAVWAMFSDPSYAALRASKLQLADPEVTVNASGDRISSTTRVAVPTEMLPAAAKRFISPNTKATLAEQWSRPSDDVIRGTMELSAAGVPGNIKLASVLTADGAKTKVTLNGTVVVTIPFLGKRLEAEAVKLAPMIVKGEQEASAEYLASH